MGQIEHFTWRVTRSENQNRPGKWEVSENQLYIQFDDPQSLVRMKAITVHPGLLSLHGMRCLGKIVEIYWASVNRTRKGPYTYGHQE